MRQDSTVRNVTDIGRSSGKHVADEYENYPRISTFRQTHIERRPGNEDNGLAGKYQRIESSPENEDIGLAGNYEICSGSGKKFNDLAENDASTLRHRGDGQSLIEELLEDETSDDLNSDEEAQVLEHNEHPSEESGESTDADRPTPTQQTIRHVETQTELTNLRDKLLSTLNETMPQEYKGIREQDCNTNEQIPSKKEIAVDSSKNESEREVRPIITKRTEVNAANSDSLLTSTKATRQIDADAWKKCIDTIDFEQLAAELLTEGKLPDKRLLNMICSKHSCKAGIVQLICRHICSHIKWLSNEIIDVWPAYRYTKGQNTQFDKSGIVFVMMTKQPTEIQTAFETYQRCVSEISSECKRENGDINDMERKSTLRDTEVEGLTACLRTNARSFMKNHSNLTRVSMSWIKASGYGAKYRCLKESACITLYVHIKGLIPINEDPFVEVIQNYDVDVREGVFELCGPANDLHQNVKMGCAIDSGYGTKQGTVGPFVKYELYSHMYYITSAHVVLDPEQMQKLINKNCVHYGEFGPDTFQPPESESVAQNMRHPLGKTELAVYREGNETEAGLEIALVHIKEERIPLDGAFPDSTTIHSKEFAAENPFVFSTGEVCERASLINSVAVYKFGCSSGLTKGLCRINGASSVRTNTLRGCNLGFDITLHGQIEIDSIDGIPFGDEGDSGSLVLTKQGDSFAAVGIFEGKMNDTYLVTPIHDVQQVLSVLLSRKRKQSQQPELGMDVEELYSPMAIKLQHVESSQGIAIGRETSNGAEGGASTSSDVETNILNYTDHKINSVKAELTAIKVHIDDTKNELVQQINQMEERVTQNIGQQMEALKEFFSNR